MLRREFVSHLLTLGAATGAVVSLSGCGTMLHPERLNQPRSHDLDWKMVALNGLGLIFFFVPGVIAFVVDFHTGAIYLPPHAHAMKPPGDDGQRIASRSAPERSEAVSGAIPAEHVAEQRVALRKMAISSGEMNLATIEREVSQHIGRPVLLSETSSRVSMLENLDQFADVRQRHHTDRAFGSSLKRFFRR